MFMLLTVARRDLERNRSVQLFDFAENASAQVFLSDARIIVSRKNQYDEHWNLEGRRSNCSSFDIKRKRAGVDHLQSRRAEAFHNCASQGIDRRRAKEFSAQDERISRVQEAENL